MLVSESFAPLLFCCESRCSFKFLPEDIDIELLVLINFGDFIVNLFSLQFFCSKDKEYNDLATIFFNTQVFNELEIVVCFSLLVTIH